MKLKFILAGGFLLFSLNTFAEETISFFGFGEQTANQLCIVESDIEGDSLIYIKSVYQAVAETNGYITTNCASVNNGRESTPAIEAACMGVNESLNVGYQLVSSIKPFKNEMAVLEKINVCELN